MILKIYSNYLLKTPPHIICFIGFCFGIVLIILSYVIDVHSFEIEGREVGYFDAINWSFNFTIIVPCIHLFLFLSFQSISSIIDKLGRYKMIVNENWIIQDKIILQNEWKKYFNLFLKVSLIFSIGCFIYAITEWYTYSGKPLLYINDPSIIDNLEFDWSVCKIGDTLTNRILNASFSFLAYIYFAILFSSVFSFANISFIESNGNKFFLIKTEIEL